MSDTPRTSNAWHEARHGENPNALLEESAKLERELVEALKWKNEDPRMLREQIRVADVAFQALHQRHDALRAGVEKLAAEYTRLADTSDDEDYITEKRALARELRALLK